MTSVRLSSANFSAFLITYLIVHSQTLSRVCPRSIEEDFLRLWSLGTHNVGIMCRVWQWRVMAVVKEAIPPAAVTDEEQCCKEH